MPIKKYVHADGLTRKILVVDDEPDFVDVLREYLMLRGFAIETATDGNTAQSLLRQLIEQLDLIISDLQMPGLNGLALLQQTRAAGYSIPFILIGGAPDRHVMSQVEKVDNAALLSKPFPFSELDICVERLLGP